jgi:hypothetical protein
MIVMSGNKFDISNMGTSYISKQLNDTIASALQMQNIISTPQIDYSKITFPEQEHRLEEKMYWEENINLLRSIELNTANLAMIVDLINKNNENQDEIIGILSEVLEIAKAKNREEADNSYRKIMQKISTFTKDVETIQKISIFACTMYTLVVNNIDKIIK